MLDNGTTTLEMMRQLQHRSRVTVITNSVPILTAALESFTGKIIFAGVKLILLFKPLLGLGHMRCWTSSK